MIFVDFFDRAALVGGLHSPCEMLHVVDGAKELRQQRN